MDLARIRSIVIWATVSLALLSVVYAPKTFLAWSNESRTWVVPPNYTYEIERERKRDFMWIKGEGYYRPYRAYAATGGKYATDWSRMAGELILIFGIGGGLIFALREKRKP